MSSFLPVVATIVASWYILEVQSQQEVISNVGPGENDEAEAHAWRCEVLRFELLSY